ncbi:hypothetical protein DAPPUDRAFT_264543 [Daphnia pulex]|uniref:C-type lectin domain-containing protein n=1 Tax=Daphnia pulex TaxID=6669 RepID=E9HRT6_DAPPU|nr:hypothetical protein DAPPUDRAFT_264543 [Daphnia pulex]|eukprot:EFX65558.1 hypothetical protein DAPPUDRAFT_264543 [Daphnia pulex]
MTILAIETPEEDKLIYDHFQKYHVNTTIRLLANTLKTNQRWEWISEWRDGISYENETSTIAPPAPGQPMTYTNWYPGQPSNVEDGNRCLGLMFNYGIPFEGGYWDDIDCDYMSGDVQGHGRPTCEMPLSSATPRLRFLPVCSAGPQAIDRSIGTYL